MDSLQNFRLSTSIVFTLLIVSAGYELKFGIAPGKPIISRIVILGLSLILSVLTSKWVINRLINWMWFRKIIMGNRSIEGFWEFYAVGNGGKENQILARPGIGEITYDGAKNGFSARFFRYAQGGDIEELASESNSLIYNEISRDYINQFQYGGSDALRTAIAYAKFSCSPGSKEIDRYDGIMFLADGSQPIRQQGKRIDKKIRAFKEKNTSEDWLKAYFLQRNQTNLQ